MSDGRCNGSSASRRGPVQRVIERTTQLDTRLTTLQASLKSLERETDRAVEVLGNLRRELERRLAVPSR